MSYFRWFAAGINKDKDNNTIVPKIYTSTNGTTWNEYTMGNNSTTWYETKCIKSGGPSKNSTKKLLVAVGNGYNNDKKYISPIIVSENEGQNWITATFNNVDFLNYNVILNSVDYNNTVYIAVGKMWNDKGSAPLLMKSYNGYDWQHEYRPFIDTMKDLEFYDVKFINTDRCIAVGKFKENGNLRYIYCSRNPYGSLWNSINWSYGNYYIPKRITYFGSQYFLSNIYSNTIFASRSNWDVSAWNRYLTNLSGEIRALTNSAPNRVIVGGQDDSIPLTYTNNGTIYSDCTIKNNPNSVINCLSKVVNGIIMAGDINGRIYRSLDNGYSWQIVFVPDPNIKLSLNSIDCVIY